MATCDDYQLGLEMHRHGATPPMPLDELHAHIAECPTCAAYGATTSEAEIMSTTHWLHNENLNPQALRDRVDTELARLRRGWRRMLWVGPLMVAGMLALTVLMGGAWQDSVVPSVAAALAVGFMLRQRLHRMSAAGDADAGHGELAARMRDDLDRQARLLRWGAPFLALVGGINLFYAVSDGDGVPKMVLSIIVLGLAVTSVFARRTLLRQLAALR